MAGSAGCWRANLSARKHARRLTSALADHPRHNGFVDIQREVRRNAWLRSRAVLRPPRRRRLERLIQSLGVVDDFAEAAFQFLQPGPRVVAVNKSAQEAESFGYVTTIVTNVLLERRYTVVGTNAVSRHLSPHAAGNQDRIHLVLRSLAL